jgi:4'-phosphopantetheinyl transferase
VKGRPAYARGIVGALTVSPPVEIWTADFSDFPGSAEHLLERLSADERARLAPVREPSLRRRFLLRRAMLRCILGAACNGAVQFTFGPHGKPALAAPGSPRFSLSHSGLFSALAVHTGGVLGIDVAAEGPLPGLDALVSRVFAPEEQASFAELPQALRLGAFYRAWLCKEALLKALGTGLTLEPNLFAVEIDPRAAPRLIASHTPLIEPARWELTAPLLPEPYQGALAIERAAWGGLSYHRFDVLSLAAQ